MRTRITATCALVMALAGCSDPLLPRHMGPEGSSEPAVSGAFSPSWTVGGTINTFHHPQSIGGDPTTDGRGVLERMSEEGPPAYRARVHGCRKMRYGNVGRMLADLGVDMSATDATSAGRMYAEADQALGAPNYDARIGETTELTTASASRLFDILVQAAPEIIAAMPSQERCQVSGHGVSVFDDAGRCTADGITCLLGEPATDEHVALCDQVVSHATSPETGRVLAVASLLAAASTCE
jgi:hypothetical protein